jgi:hypothetical protein
MKISLKNEPRVFTVKGKTIKDFGEIFLDDSEMITFSTFNNKKYDFTAKSWGFYATPSMNSRLKKEGFKTALVVNENNQIYIMVIDIDKMDQFLTYLKDEQDHKILCWLDDWMPEMRKY